MFIVTEYAALTAYHQILHSPWSNQIKHLSYYRWSYMIIIWYEKKKIALNSSVVSAATTVGANLFQWGNSLWEERILQASLLVWGLQYCEMCDNLVSYNNILDLVLWDGVKYLSLSIDLVPQWILWKKSREDWSFRASRVGHCSSLSISPTLLVLRHLLQVQRAAVLCTFSTCVNLSFTIWAPNKVLPTS